MSINRSIIEKLKKILNISDRIKMKQMRNILKLDEEIFDEKIVDWAYEFGFRIDGDYIKINRDTVGDFIDRLDGQFKLWERQETTGTGKIEDSEPVSPSILEQEDLMGKETIISFRGVQIPQFEADMLTALEQQANKQFSNVAKVEWNDTQMGFTVENNRVTGIGLCECGVSTLLESIGNLTSLQMLYLRNNQLTTLPESIGNLSSLEKLDLYNNKLLTFPESITELTSLEILRLSSNKLTTLPGSIGNLISLQTLSLNNNKFTTLPESIGNLTSLKELSLRDNKLTTLPESIGNLKSLEELVLGINQLRILPESIGDLSSLKELYLYVNNLSTLPESIGQLSSLKVLRLDDNRLSTLPESMTNLTSLKRLFTPNNPLDSRAKSVLKQLKKKGVDVYLYAKDI